MRSMSKLVSGVRRRAIHLVKDRRGLAAVEFAFILPLMLVMFFGTVEFSSGVAIDRKVTIMARTLSDLTSQNTSVTDTQLTNFFAASTAIMSPYAPQPVLSTVSELYVDPNSLSARVQWSKGAGARTVGSTVPIPTSLQVAGTYLIFSEISYLYQPSVGYVMAPTGVNLADVAYTRPRQSLCVFYPPAATTTTPCPTS
jgi:Flp pilus assembly protein TadG